MSNQKVWLITGISKGLGKEIAKISHKNGNQVIGFVRKEADRKLLETELTGIKIYILDLANADEIPLIVDEIIKKYGKIDVLVNNAGYGMFGLFEEVSINELRKQFEVNVFAKWSLINAVLPSMRRQKSGIIIQISSRLGIIAGIGNSAYSSAEFAIEGMSESLAEEVKPFGIKVMLVEPGPMRTSFFGSSIHFAEKEISDYQESLGNLRNIFRSKNGTQKGNPRKIAEAIVNEASKENVPFRVPLTSITIDALDKKAKNYTELSAEWAIIANSVDDL